MPSWRLSANLPGQGPGAPRGGASQAAAKIAPALIPVPAHDAGAWEFRGAVVGSPGTTRIPAPANSALNGIDRNPVAQAQTGWIGLPSSDFSYWRPSIYIQFPRSRVNVSVFSDNQMPVPAIDPRGLPAVAMPGPVMLNHFQVPNPRKAAKFPPLRKRPRTGTHPGVDR